LLTATATKDVIIGLDERSLRRGSSSPLEVVALAKKTPNMLLYIGEELMDVDLVVMARGSGNGNGNRTRVDVAGVQVIENEKKTTTPVVVNGDVARSEASRVFLSDWYLLWVACVLFTLV
jgi:predicted HAD superfamily phosphohydrolase